MTPAARRRSPPTFRPEANRYRRLAEATRRLRAAVDALSFSPPVSHVYNPLEYARRPHDRYLARFSESGHAKIIAMAIPIAAPRAAS